MGGKLELAVIVCGYVLALANVMHIVLQRREPTATLAWVIGIVLLPYLGMLLYILVGRRRLDRQLRRRRVRAADLEPHLDRREEGIADLLVPSAPDYLCKPDERELIRLSNRIGLRYPTCGNEVTLLVDAQVTYQSIVTAIEEAQDHIHLLYYIYQADETGGKFRDLLISKLRQGVEVRLLVDGVGSFGLSNFMEPLIRAGGAFGTFLPVGRLSRHWHPNLRNHRKIVIVDGACAFTGGLNVGDEYTGRKRRVGPWRDTHIKVRGPAVNHLQEIFAEDWNFATGENLIEERWFPEQQAAGDLMLQVIASGPDTDTQPIQRIFFAAVTSAERRVYLTTPYFVPDQPLLVAMEVAALRGVDVRLLLPAKSDMRLVLHAGRSYYDELLESGVKIYEYQGGVLHAKTMVVDNRWATVGSANMDVRSFQLNFEVNAAIYGSEFARELAEMFESDLTRARRITLDDIRRKGFGRRVAEGFARMLSPVL